jgi:predicted MFS family arabinose efflux permease
VLDRVLDESYAPAVRREITPLTAGRLAANGCYRFAPPFLATIARGLDVSLSELGAAIAITEFVGLASPMLGRRIDRLPRRSTITIGLIGVIVGTLVAAASVNVAMFAVGLVVLAAAKICYDVSLGAWIVDHVPYERRSRIVGLTETSWALGLLIGVTTMGVVAALTSWRWGYAAGALGVAAALSWIMARVSAGGSPQRPPSPPTPDRRQEPAARVGGLRQLDPAARWMLVAAFGLMGSSQTMFVTFGAWLEHDFEFSAAALSAVTFGLGALELGASSLSALRTDRWGKERSVMLGAGIMIPSGLALAALDGSLVPGLLLLGIFFAGFEFAIVSSLAVAGTLVPGAPAHGLGALIAAGTLARGLLAVPATVLFERHGLGASALIGVGCAVLTVTAVGRRLRLLGAGAEEVADGVRA